MLNECRCGWPMLVELRSVVLLPLIEENSSEDHLKLNELENTVMPKISEVELMAFIHISRNCSYPFLRL